MARGHPDPAAEGAIAVKRFKTVWHDLEERLFAT
jgi:hypothetical protein